MTPGPPALVISVPANCDEFAELAIGDRRAVDPEAVHTHAVHRGLFGIVLVGTHAKRAAGNPHHAVVWIGSGVCSG